MRLGEGGGFSHRRSGRPDEIDKGGKFRWAGTDLHVGITRQFTTQLSAAAGGATAGGAGLELAYAWPDDWEIAGGAACRDYRFRLSSDAPTPNGLGRNSGAPIFSILTRKFGPVAQIDLHAGLVVGGRLPVPDAASSTVQSSDDGVSPLITFSATIGF